MSNLNRSIRCIALGVICHNRHLLVQVIQEHPTPIYRPLGGQIEFGEYAEDTVLREFAEELAWDVSIVSRIGWIENIFQHQNEMGHEVVCLFHLEVRNQPRKLAARNFLEDHDTGEHKTATWVPIEQFVNGNAHLVPLGLLRLIVNSKIIEE